MDKNDILDTECGAVATDLNSSVTLIYAFSKFWKTTTQHPNVIVKQKF